MAASAKKTWRCINKCYAGGAIYRPGDTVDGGDFSKNDNFVEDKTTDNLTDENGGTGTTTLPPA